MNRLQCLIRLARALDYNRDPDPEHWKTINGAKVHLDKNGNYDGGAGGKFNGNHHYGGPDWKQKKEAVNSLYHAFSSVAKQKQAQENAQGNQAGNTSAQNVASKATQNGTNGVTITEEEEKGIERVRNLRDTAKRAEQEYDCQFNSYSDSDYIQNLDDAMKRLNDAYDQFETASKEATAKGVPFVSMSWFRIEDEILSKNITKVPVTRHVKQPTDEEIISRVAGEDMTEGSCASAAFAYVANKCGLNALDFRGGDSRELFASAWIKSEMLNFPGIKGKNIEDVTNAPAATGATMLLELKKNKEYYFAFGMHAAIVKNTDRGVEYLELQSPFSDENGWNLMGDNERSVSQKLQDRFEVPERESRTYYLPLTLLEVDSFKGNREFAKLVEYFNTNETEQMKGVRGRVR